MSGRYGPNVESYIAWALATDPACLQAGVDTYEKDYDVILSTIADLRRDSPTLLIALNVYDANLRGPDLQGAKVPPQTREEMDRWVIGAYERWNPMVCNQARRHGFMCVDIYHAFNGPNGDQTAGELLDGAHPSQSGNDVIAGLLKAVDATAIGP